MTPENQYSEEHTETAESHNRSAAEILTERYQDNPYFVMRRANDNTYMTLDEVIAMTEQYVASRGFVVEDNLEKYDRWNQYAIALEAQAENSPEAKTQIEEFKAKSRGEVVLRATKLAEEETTE